MVNNHYRWDFIGLSTDEKPTPETSEKVVNGSTFYCSDTSKLYVFCDGTWYERKPLGGGGGGGGSYTAGYGIDITSDEISVDDQVIATKQDLSGKQDTLTAGSNITISDDTISATDTTYSAFTGTDGTTAGAAGLVPAPATTDANKFLKSDGTWDTAGGGSSVNVVQTTGTSTTDVMSQNATTGLVYADPGTNTKIKIGDHASDTEGANGIEIGHYAKATGSKAIAIGGGDGSWASAQATGEEGIAVGGNAIANTWHAIAIGSGANVTTGLAGVAIGSGASAKNNSIAIGTNANATVQGQFDISAGVNNEGYDHTNYRLITGVHDGQSAHDAVTVGQVNAVIDAINTALSTNIPHIGA